MSVLRLCAGALLAMLVAAPATAAGSGLPYQPVTAQLDNGLTVVVFETHRGSGIFSMYELVGTGSRDEVEPGHSGFAHFFEHMMFRGTEKFPADKRNQLLSQLGVDDGGYTTDDFTMYHLVGPSEALSSIMELEADRYMNLTYSEEAFRTEAKAVLGEYNKNFSNPDRRAWEAVRDLAFDQHTYQHTTLGFLKDIERMPEELAYSRQFFQRYYTPDNVVLFVAGDVDATEVIGEVKKRWSGWQGTRQKLPIPTEPPQTAERRQHVAWESSILPRLFVAWRVPSSADDPQSAALCSLLETYLFHESAPLHRELVVEQDRIDSMGSWWTPHKDPSLFPVVVKLKPKTPPDEVLGRVQAALDEVAAGKVDAKRFAAVKSHIRYVMLMALTSPEAVAKVFAYYAGHAFEPGALARLTAAVDALEPADLVAFTKKHFGQAQRTVVTVAGPAGGAR